MCALNIIFIVILVTSEFLRPPLAIFKSNLKLYIKPPLNVNVYLISLGKNLPKNSWYKWQNFHIKGRQSESKFWKLTFSDKHEIAASQWRVSQSPGEKYGNSTGASFHFTSVSLLEIWPLCRDWGGIDLQTK